MPQEDPQLLEKEQEAADMKTDKTERAEIISKDLEEIIDKLTSAIDDMTRDFKFTMDAMESISQLLKQTPPDIEVIRIILNRFF